MKIDVFRMLLCCSDVFMFLHLIVFIIICKDTKNILVIGVKPLNGFV